MRFKNEIEINEKLNGEIRNMKVKIEGLQDECDKLELDLNSMTNDKMNALNENVNLEKVIKINGDQLKRIQQQLN